MNRIEEIKEKLEESDGYREWFADGWNRNKGAIDDLIGHNKHLSESIHHLLSKLEIADKALTYYADLYRNLYNNIEHGELYENWLLRQGKTAVEALQQIRS